MHRDTNQTKSRTALFCPAVPTLKAFFYPGDDFALWAFRAKTHLQDTPPEHLWQYLIPLLDGVAARQFLATAVPILSGPDIICPALEELFALYELSPAFLEKLLERRRHLAESVDEYAACLRVLATKAYPKASKEVRDEHILGPFTTGISDPKTKEDFLPNVPTSLQSALLRTRKLEARTEALRQSPKVKIADIPPAVFKPQPSRRPSVSYPGQRPYCRHCRKFGSRSQHCGHNPATHYTGRLMAANGTIKPIPGQMAGSVSIGRRTIQHHFLCADVAWEAALGMDFLRAHLIVTDFDRQRSVVNKRPGPIGQLIAALKMDSSLINEMLLGECVDRETNR
ncbi:hypothetical protein D915_002942 [Fasciola hepatica]|uniref:Retrotransposon gag domain-containing protein n=1 Tax=Fasciola hepatica TaxID=6192 RepID=A0A4E0RFH9_FASHE|nr:hypothetical protein D915_002942 [Fasciola hepatica]